MRRTCLAWSESQRSIVTHKGGSRSLQTGFSSTSSAASVDRGSAEGKPIITRQAPGGPRECRGETNHHQTGSGRTAGAASVDRGSA